MLLAGGVVSKNQVFAAWLCFSSPPRLLFFLQVLIAITPGWGEVRSAETNGCCQVAGLGWEERAASQPALCYTGGLQGCCCPSLHSTSRGYLGEVYFGEKRSFSIYLALRTRQKRFATCISSQPCSSVVAARWHRQNRTQIWPRMYPRVIPPGVLMSEMEEVSGDQEPRLGLSRSPQRQPMCLVSRRGGEARLTAATAC